MPTSSISGRSSSSQASWRTPCRASRSRPATSPAVSSCALSSGIVCAPSSTPTISGSRRPPPRRRSSSSCPTPSRLAASRSARPCSAPTSPTPSRCWGYLRSPSRAGSRRLGYPLGYRSWGGGAVRAPCSARRLLSRRRDRGPITSRPWCSRNTHAGNIAPSPCPLPRWGRGMRGRGSKLAVEGLTALVAVPETDQVALLARQVAVAERGAAVGEEPVVQVLHLALLDPELDAELRRVGDASHGLQGLADFVVEAGSRQAFRVLDEALIVAAV